MALEILTEQVPRGIKGSKPSPNHHGQACRREEASCQREKLGLSGTQGLGAGGRGEDGVRKGFWNRDHLSWSCKYVNNYVRGTGHFRAAGGQAKGRGERKEPCGGADAGRSCTGEKAQLYPGKAQDMVQGEDRASSHQVPWNGVGVTSEQADPLSQT